MIVGWKKKLLLERLFISRQEKMFASTNVISPLGVIRSSRADVLFPFGSLIFFRADVPFPMARNCSSRANALFPIGSLISIPSYVLFPPGEKHTLRVNVFLSPGNSFSLQEYLFLPAGECRFIPYNLIRKVEEMSRTDKSSTNKEAMIDEKFQPYCRICSGKISRIGASNGTVSRRR